jgi:hypothetical protein
MIFNVVNVDKIPDFKFQIPFLNKKASKKRFILRGPFWEKFNKKRV